MSKTEARDYHEHFENIVAEAASEQLAGKPVVAKLLAIPNVNDDSMIDIVTELPGFDGKESRYVWATVHIDFFSGRMAYQSLASGQSLKLKIVEE